MGSKMESKYDGKCSKCETSWKTGTIIYYNKEPKIICTNSECFSEQGGKISEFSSSGNNYKNSNFPPSRTLEQKLSDMAVLDDHISKLATERLSKIELKLGGLAPSEKLVFLESWARTIATSFNQR